MSKENFFETALPEIKAVKISLVSTIMMKAYSELGLDEIQLIGDAEFALYFRNKEVIPCSCTGNKGADKYRLKLDGKAKESSKQFLKLEPTRMIRETSSFEMEKRLDSVLLDMYKVKIETEIDKTSDVVNVLIVNPSFYFIDEWIRYFYENDRYSKRLCTVFILETRGLWEYLGLLRKAFAPHKNVFFRSADEIPELKSKMNGMKNLYYFLGCFFYRNKFNSIANERVKSIFRCCDEVIATYEYEKICEDANENLWTISKNEGMSVASIWKVHKYLKAENCEKIVVSLKKDSEVNHPIEVLVSSIEHKKYFSLRLGQVVDFQKLVDSRSFDQLLEKNEEIEKRNKFVFSYSKEIKMKYTIDKQEGRNNRLGIYYHYLLPQPLEEGSKRKIRKTKTKFYYGLKEKDLEEKEKYFLEEIESCRGEIVDDIFRNATGLTREELYNLNDKERFQSCLQEIGKLSFKTIWYCFQDLFVACDKYDNELTKKVLENKGIADLGISNFNYESFIQEIGKLAEQDLSEWIDNSLDCIIAVLFEYKVLKDDFFNGDEDQVHSNVRARYILKCLRKSAFTKAELNRFVGIVFQKDEEGNYEIVKNQVLLFSVFKMYLGMKNGEILALKWKDISKCEEIDISKIEIYKTIKNDEVVSYLELKELNKCRPIPCSKILRYFLRERYRLIKKVFHKSDDILKEEYIFMSEEGIRIRLDKILKGYKHVLKEMNFSDLFIALMTSDLETEETKTVNLNSGRKDIARANFQYYCREVGMTEGQIGYLLGLKLGDPLNRNYCDYSNEIMLYNLYIMMSRWWPMLPEIAKKKIVSIYLNGTEFKSKEIFVQKEKTVLRFDVNFKSDSNIRIISESNYGNKGEVF